MISILPSLRIPLGLFRCAGHRVLDAGGGQVGEALVFGVELLDGTD
jgi:hypothetical protein